MNSPNSDEEEEFTRCFQQLSTSVDKKARRDALKQLVTRVADGLLSVPTTLWTNLDTLVRVADEDTVDSNRANALQTLLNLFDTSSPVTSEVSYNYFWRSRKPVVGEADHQFKIP